MSLEKRIFYDKSESMDTHNTSIIYPGNGIKKTDIMIFDEITGEMIQRTKNKVIVAGSSFTACKHFDIAPAVTLPNYNTALSLDQTISTPAENIEKVILFGVGIDGCGAESSQVYEVKYSNWTQPVSLVPFRYQPIATDISLAERNIYFGRKQTADKIAYYFKVFESNPVMKQQYVDGTPIDSNLYSSLNVNNVETYVELKLKITNTDCRDFFKATSGIATAKVNSITLLTAWVKTVGSYKYYQNIQPLTKLNIQNESLFDETKGLDIIYHIYY